MIKAKHILFSILALNLTVMIVVFEASRQASLKTPGEELPANDPIKKAYALRADFLGDSGENMMTDSSLEQRETTFKWNPFEVLGAYPEIPLKYFNTYPDKKIMYNETDHGLINEDDYCTRVDSYNLEHPENMFEQMNFFTDYDPKSEEAMVRELVIREIGNDTLPEVSIHMGSSAFNSRKYILPVQVTNYFTKKVDLHMYHQIGKNFLCATQMFNHIPGHGVIKRKDLIVGTISKYAEEFQTRPHCFDKDKFFPLSYRLYRKSECLKFFKILDSTNYKKKLAKEPIQYLLKVGVGRHKASGVSLIGDDETEFLMKKYKNGTACGTNFESYVAQKYIANPLLLDRNNKFDFRIYMLIASTNPLIVYYHDGFIRASLSSYNRSSTTKDTHLTNTFLAMKKFKDINGNEKKIINGMTEQEAKDYMLWSFDRLEKYLLQSGKIKDKNWLNNYLRPVFRRAFVHAARMAAKSLWNQSNVYELFGLDFMLDDKLNLWLIECNSSPQLLESNGREFMVGMMIDVFEIEYAYYRSRMMRILRVIRNLQKEQEEKGTVDFDKYRKDYENGSRNRLEQEYEIRKENSWTIVMDKNLPAGAAYYGNIPSECA